MDTARRLHSGRSQAVRLPKDPRFRITQAKPPDGGRKSYSEGAAEQPGVWCSHGDGGGRSRTFLGLLEGLPISVDQPSTASAWHDTLALARSHRLTTYAAAYLELALRRGLPLATRDKALQAAARLEGVPLMPC